MRRVVQIALVVADLALISAWKWFGQGESIQPLRDVDASLSSLWLILWWWSPAFVLFLHRSWSAALVTGIALLGASVFALHSIYSSTHSTAAIGFLTVPVLRWVLAVALFAAPALLAYLTKPFMPPPGGAGPPGAR